MGLKGHLWAVGDSLKALEQCHDQSSILEMLTSLELSEQAAWHLPKSLVAVICVSVTSSQAWLTMLLGYCLTHEGGPSL